MSFFAQALKKSSDSSIYAMTIEKAGIYQGIQQWKGQGLFSIATLVAVAVGWIGFCICGAIYRRMISS